MNYLPFNSIDHDRVYKAEDWAWYFSTFISNGVFPAPANGLQVLAGDAMTVEVQAGFGFINGYAFRNPQIYSIDIPVADGTLSRIDRVVLRWDLQQRMMYLTSLIGTVSADPQPPALSRTADIWDLALADISVDKGLTTITQAQIKDDRYNSDLCGICAGVIDQIDASTLTAQFDSFFDQYTKTITSDYDNYTASIEAYESAWKDSLDEWRKNQETSQSEWQSTQWQAFNDWLATIKDALGDEAAANLADASTKHDERITILEYMNRFNDYFAPILDDDDCYILDDDGNALFADWKYKYA